MQAPAYAVDIPPLAPAAAGAALDTADIDAAERELPSRKRLRAVDSPAVTDGEVAAALVRKEAIVMQHAAVRYGDAVPQWAEDLRLGIQAIQAQIQNARLRKRNSGARRHGGSTPWLPLLKENAGLMGVATLRALLPPPAPVAAPSPKKRQRTAPPEPEQTEQTELPAVPAEVPAVGTRMPGFPASADAVTALSHTQVLGLVQWYNDDMGIVPADSLATRVNKVCDWIVL
eukprot:m51a1_g8293 hypothetical protein (230) ;mRNA; r:166832-167697